MTETIADIFVTGSGCIKTIFSTHFNRIYVLVLVFMGQENMNISVSMGRIMKQFLEKKVPSIGLIFSLA